MSTAENIGVNVVLLRGSLSSEPVARDLNSGSSVIGLEVTTRHDDEPTRSVPVSIFDPAKPDEVLALTTGDEVLWSGRSRDDSLKPLVVRVVAPR